MSDDARENFNLFCLPIHKFYLSIVLINNLTRAFYAAK